MGLLINKFSDSCKFLILLVLPTGFEPVAFHLGGERSIQLSYGSLIDFGFWIADYGLSRIVTDQRLNIIPVKLLSAAQKIQLDNE